MAKVDISDEKLEKILALLSIIAGAQIKEIQDKREKILAVPKKLQIYEACDGKHNLYSIAKKVKVSHEYVRVTILDLEKVGLIVIRKKGKNMYPWRAL